MVAHPFNFYTFPRTFQGKFSRDICLNNDCIEFHEKVGTDMSRWIYKGVNYFQKAIWENVEKIALGVADEEKSDKSKDELVAGLSDSDRAAYQEKEKVYVDWVSTEEPTLSLTDNRGSVRKCLYSLIENKTPNFYYLVTENPKLWREKTITIYRATKEQGDAFRAEQAKKKQDEFEKTLGFSRVWKQLINFKKPVIGHNMYLDLLFTFEHYHGYNPANFGRFKEIVHECWPQLYDTKVLSSELGREDVSGKMNLEELYEKLQEMTQIKVKVADGFIDYTQDSVEAFHDAGYDAFVTGSCYYMLSKLEGAADVIDSFANRIRLGTSRMFLADFSNPDNDLVTADKMFVISVIEKAKEGDKIDIQKLQNEVLGALKDEHKVGIVYSYHNNPAAMYQKVNYMSFFFGFDKKL